MCWLGLDMIIATSRQGIEGMACDITMRHIPRDPDGSGARFLNPTAKGSPGQRTASKGKMKKI